MFGCLWGVTMSLFLSQTTSGRGFPMAFTASSTRVPCFTLMFFSLSVNWGRTKVSLAETEKKIIEKTGSSSLSSLTDWSSSETFNSECDGDRWAPGSVLGDDCPLSRVLRHGWDNDQGLGSILFNHYLVVVVIDHLLPWGDHGHVLQFGKSKKCCWIEHLNEDFYSPLWNQYVSGIGLPTTFKSNLAVWPSQHLHDEGFMTKTGL